MLRFITGPAGPELSQKLIEKLTAEAANGDPLKKYFIIVPEQFTLQTQLNVAKTYPKEACMNIDVVSFDRLALVSLAKLGQEELDVLDDIGKSLVLRSVLSDCALKLKVYRSKVHMQGFLEEVKSLVTELKQYAIDDEKLGEMQEQAQENGNQLLASKLDDIRLIYSSFNEKIAGSYTTAEEILDVFERRIPESEFIKGAEIYLDGFTGFTPIQNRLIGRFLEYASNVTCSVVLPDEKIDSQAKEFDIFKLSNDTFFRLQRIADERKVPITVEKIDAEVKGERDKKVFLVNPATTRDEIIFTAREAVRLVREEDLRYRDIAVLASDMNSYYMPVRDIFREADIPVFIDYKTEITDNPLVRYLLAAIGLVGKSLNAETLFNFLKTGLSGMEKDDISLIENYCLEFDIKGPGKWKQDFTKNRKLRGREAYAWDLEKINGIREAVNEQVQDFYAGIQGSMAARSYCERLKKLLEKNKIEVKMAEIAKGLEEKGDLEKAKQYEQIYERVDELLTKIADLLGKTKLQINEFKGILESGIREIKIGIIPPSLDAMTVGDITRTRLGNVKVLFLVGANDGKIPRGAGGSCIFTQKEREQLKDAEFELAPTVQENIYTQRFYLYMNFAKPEKALYVTYANASSAGESLSPSCIIDELEELTGGIRAEKLFPDDRCCWKADAMRESAKAVRKYVDNNELPSERLMEFFSVADAQSIRGFRQILNGAFYTNRQSAIDQQTALDLYGGVLKGSVSRFETFFECPYRHFLNYGMGLEKRREFEIKVTDLGTVYHDSLELYSNELKEEGFDFRTVSDEDSHRICEKCTREAIENMESDVLDQDSRTEYFKTRIIEITEKTTDILRDQVKAGEFEPTHFEYGFTDDTTAANVEFNGRIDRVDLYEAGDIFVKIIDYKSGNKKFAVEDIYNGIQLQLVAYLDQALKNTARENPGKNVRPGGVYYYLVRDKYLREDDQKNKNRMSGLTSSEDGVVHAIDGTISPDGKKSSEIIPVTYSSKGFDSRSSTIASEGEIENMIGFVRDKISEAGEKIQNGCIELEPYFKDERTNGCSYCDFKDICRFEPGCFGTDWKKRSGLETKEMGDVIYGRN